MDRPKQKSWHSVLIIALGFIVLFLWHRQIIFLYLSLGIALLGTVSGFLARKIDYLWRQLGYLLGLIMPKILLTLLFFLLLTPLALLSRLFSREDPLMLKRHYKSHLKDYQRQIDKDYFEKTW